MDIKLLKQMVSSTKNHYIRLYEMLVLYKAQAQCKQITKSETLGLDLGSSFSSQDNNSMLYQLLKQNSESAHNPEEAKIQQVRKSKPKRIGRDENKLKRPKTAFFRYSEEKRHEIKQREGKIMNIPQFQKEVGEQWNNLTVEQKQPYYDSYKIDKERYDKEIKPLRASTPRNSFRKRSRTAKGAIKIQDPIPDITSSFKVPDSAFQMTKQELSENLSDSIFLPPTSSIPECQEISGETPQNSRNIELLQNLIIQQPKSAELSDLLIAPPSEEAVAPSTEGADVPMKTEQQVTGQ